MGLLIKLCFNLVKSYSYNIPISINQLDVLFLFGNQHNNHTKCLDHYITEL